MVAWTSNIIKCRSQSARARVRLTSRRHVLPLRPFAPGELSGGGIPCRGLHNARGALREALGFRAEEVYNAWLAAALLSIRREPILHSRPATGLCSNFFPRNRPPFGPDRSPPESMTIAAFVVVDAHGFRADVFTTRPRRTSPAIYRRYARQCCGSSYACGSVRNVGVFTFLFCRS